MRVACACSTPFLRYAGCISGQIVALDATPSPGYRSFLNFLGVLTPPELATLDATLASATVSAMQHNQKHAAYSSEARASAPGLLAVLHHPLCALQQAGSGRGVRQMSERSSAPDAASPKFRRLHEVLARRRASLVVSGHLHDAFGPRLHGYHLLRPLTFPDVSGGDERCAGGRCRPRLLEAETADWKFRRRFRVLSTTTHAVPFTDARFVVARGLNSARSAQDAPAAAELPPGELRCHVEAEDPTAHAAPYLIHVSEPPDGRYFPARSGSGNWRLRSVNASLVWTHGMVWRDGAAAHAPPQPPQSVTAHLSCFGVVNAWRETFTLTLEDGMGGATLLHASAAVPEALLTQADACSRKGGALRLQVRADVESLGEAASGLRPIHFKADDATAPLDMGNSALEALVVRTEWVTVILVMYMASLAAAIVALLLARLLRHRVCRIRCGRSSADSSGADAAAASTTGGELQTIQPGSAREPETGSQCAQWGRACLCALLHPVSVLVRFSHWRAGWAAAVAYLVGLAGFPHALARPATTAGVLAHTGRPRHHFSRKPG